MTEFERYLRRWQGNVRLGGILAFYGRKYNFVKRGCRVKRQSFRKKTPNRDKTAECFLLLRHNCVTKKKGSKFVNTVFQISMRGDFWRNKGRRVKD